LPASSNPLPLLFVDRLPLTTCLRPRATTIPEARVPGGQGHAVPLSFATLPDTLTPLAASTTIPPARPRHAVKPCFGAPNTAPLARIFTTATTCVASSTVASAPSRDRIFTDLSTLIMHSQPKPTSAASS